ncbi:MAG: prolyl oligopeptidase family serine peptidase [Longimicrobiales bacterium]
MKSGSLVTWAAFAVLGGSAAVVACSRSPYPPPPGTRVETVVDTLHGVAFEDDYRWLEEQDAPETRAWIAAQNAYAEAIVGESLLRDRFRTTLRTLIDVPEVGTTQKAGEFEYFTMQRAGEPMERLYRRPAPASGDTSKPALSGEYDVVLDPGVFDPANRTIISLMDFSPDGRVMMYSVRQGGADEIEVRFRDVTTGEDLPDRLPNALYGGVEFSADGKAITYVHRSRQDGPRLRRHVLGTDMSTDVELYGDGLPPTSFLGTDLVDDGRLRILSVQNGWAGSDVYVQDTRSGEIRTVVADSNAHVAVRWHDGRLWILTDLGAPKYRLAMADPVRPGPENWNVVIPESDDVLQNYAFIGNRIHATYLHEVSDRIRVFEMDGTPAGQVEVPPYMSANIRSGEDGEALLTLNGHLAPATTWSIDIASGERVITDSADVPFDATGYVVEQTWFTSKDGTRAAMYVIHREGIPMDGSHPTILNGYGGFNSSIEPSFSTTAAAWLQMGGVYAIATLRGGSEFGEEWHRAGMLENKQNVFDDFIAAAEHLIASGYTDAHHLGIMGGSNGGLLVASAMTQRPDLFRAVLCTYPDLDMVRFYTFTETNNLPALLEYGDARIPEQFEAIRQYSPYQRVTDNVRYPAVMLATGDLDTRVPPLQARKMTARLQAATSSGLPVILWYDERGGHAAGRGRPLSLLIEDGARELTFMAQQLGLVVTPSAN